jgi:molybdopterin-guanine dinucleotide biosynthesis protein A
MALAMYHCDNGPSPERFAYILAGGKSSRFGSSKALVKIAGVPQIQRLAKELDADSWQSVAVSQNFDEFQSLGLRTLGDIEPDQGPVAGILAGLIDLQATGTQSRPVWPWGLFITCDLWKWDPRWTERLRPPSDTDCGDTVPEVALLIHFQADRFYPFPCMIHRDALPKIQQAWRSGCRSMRQLFESLAPSAIPRDLSEDFLPESFNTLEEFKRLQGERS